MLIYLVRHGIAVDKAESDAPRELTGEGLKQTRSLVEKWRMYSPMPDKALMSPYQRARQTAAPLRPLFPTLRMEVDKQIEPDGDPYGVLDYLEQCGAQQILLVGHNPLLSNLLSILVDGTLETNRYIGNSTLVCISMDFVAPGCGEIQYTLEP
jgi:phosphohistidine phosphatase